MSRLEIGMPRGYWLNLQCSGELPEPRSGHVALLAKSQYMYVIGGMNTTTAFNDVHCLDLHSLVWQRVFQNTGYSKNIPSGRCSHAGALDPLTGLIYIHGGSGERFGQSNDGKLFVFNPHSASWQLVSTIGTAPSPRYGHSLCFYKDRLILFGGTAGTVFFRDFYLFHLSSKSWEQLELEFPYPKKRYKHSAHIMEDSMIILGGYSGKPRNDVWCLDLVAYDWRKLAEDIMPEGRYSHSAELFDGKVYVYGGNNTSVQGDMWKFNAKKQAAKPVVQLGPKPAPRAFHTAVSCDGYLVLFGGNTGQGKLNDTIAYRLTDYVPKYVPSISRLFRFVNEPSILTDTRIKVKFGEFYSQLALLRVRVPLIAQYAEPSDSMNALTLDTRGEVIQHLLLYVYTDQIDSSISLDVLLDLLFLAVSYGVYSLVTNISAFLMRSLLNDNVALIAGFLCQHREAMTVYETHLARYSGIMASVLASNCNLAAIDALYNACVHYASCQVAASQSGNMLATAVSKFKADLLNEATQPATVPEISSSLDLDLEYLWTDEAGKDFSVELVDGRLAAHKFILMTGSEYFKNFIELGNCSEGMLDFPSAEVQRILKFLYLGPKVIDELEPEEVVDLLHYADYLQLNDTHLKDYIGSMVSDSLTVDNALEFLLKSEQMHATVMKHLILEFIMENYQEVTQRSQMDALSSELLTELMSWRAVIEQTQRQ